MKQKKINKLATERSSPCVTISMNTHRTHPDNAVDVIGLRNLLTEAQSRVVNEYGKRDVSDLLLKIDNLEKEIDCNQNLDSLHIFISNSTKEILKSPIPTLANTVHVSDSFAIKPLIKILNRTEEYFILLLSQSGVKLLLAINDTIAKEIINDDFPFSQNSYYLTDKDKLSDGKQVDNMVREYLNVVDKAMQKEYNAKGLNCIVICTEDNYSRLMQVADNPSIYYGYANINYNDTKDKSVAAQAWHIMKGMQQKHIEDAIEEMLEAVGQSKVTTELSEIFKAVKEGKGDLLIINDKYQQAVKMTSELSFELAEDVTQPEVIDDIISEIAWEVITKNGRAIFVAEEYMKQLGSITLKFQY